MEGPSTAKRTNIKPRTVLLIHLLLKVLSKYIILTLRSSKALGGLMEILDLTAMGASNG